MSLAPLPLFAPCPLANKPQQAPSWSQAAQRDCCQKGDRRSHERREQSGRDRRRNG